MPLARTFLNAFDRLPQAHQAWVHLYGLYGYLKDQKGVDPAQYLSESHDIEDLHSEIYEAALASLGPELTPEAIFSFKAHHELIFLFAYVVNLIQNGPVSPIHCQLAKLLGDGDGVITFNWDTLMDRALAECTQWRVDTGYGIEPHRVFRDGWQSPDRVYNSSRIVLWKLHGSSNWVTSHEQFEGGKLILIQSRPADTLHVFESATTPYPCYRGRFMPGYEPFSFGYYPPNILDDPGKSAGPNRVLYRAQMIMPGVPEGAAERHGLVSMPLIIPPVKSKSYDRFGGLFDTVWNGAANLLASADHVVTIGYSFPRTDDRSLDLFQRAFARRPSPPRVVVVDPVPERAISVFRDVLSVPSSHLRICAEALTHSSQIAEYFK
jgi:hypothetical protein